LAVPAKPVYPCAIEGEEEMDVESLRNELEGFLGRNPDADAPHGFRARFEAELCRYGAASGDDAKAAIEQQLRQICSEAEIADKAAETERTETAAATAESAARAEAPAVPVDPGGAPAAETAPAPASGGFLAYGIGILIAILAIAGAYVFFRL
jgi:hypothetical protein